eukprot:471251-Rhodomonas_salina.1
MQREDARREGRSAGLREEEEDERSDTCCPAVRTRAVMLRACALFSLALALSRFLRCLPERDALFAFSCALSVTAFLVFWRAC